MPRASRFNKKELKGREREARVARALIERLLQNASFDKTQQGEFARNLREILFSYRARMIAHQQERPSRLVAALRPGLISAKKLRKWLDSLPHWLRFELRAGGIESALDDLIENTEVRSAYWHSHSVTNRPPGEAEIGTSLRKQLSDLIATYWSDPAQRKSVTKLNQRRWVADVAKAIGAKYPDEKKNRRRFAGERPPDHAAPTQDTVKRPKANKTRETTALERRLRNIAI